MIAAVYLRVSTDEQAREGLSLAVQEERCREAALADGCAEVRVFCDDGYSGTSRDRPALQELLGQLDALDVVYLWKLDRLSRSNRDTLNIVADLAEKQVGLKSVTETFDYSSPAGRMMMQMLGAFAEFFVANQRESIVAAQQRRVEQGGYIGTPPLGYDWERDGEGKAAGTGRLVVVPEQAAIVQQVYRRFAQGTSLTAIVRELQAQERRGKQGATDWQVGTVRSLLANPLYLGKVAYKGALHDGDHEAIIGSQLWASAQRRLRQRASAHPRSRDSSFSPLLRCGVCGGSVRLAHGRRTGGKLHKSYGCSRRRMVARAKRHRPVMASRVAVDAVIWAWTERLISDGALAQAAEEYRRREEAKGRRDEAQALRDRAAELDEAVAYNLEAARAGAVSIAILARQNEPLLQEREALQEKLEGLEAEAVSAQELRWTRELSEAALPRMRTAPVGRQRELLERIFERVELADHELTFHHRYPGLPDQAIPIPRYYSPARGVTHIELP